MDRPFWPQELHFGPFRSANCILANGTYRTIPQTEEVEQISWKGAKGIPTKGRGKDLLNVKKKGRNVFSWNCTLTHREEIMWAIAVRRFCLDNALSSEFEPFP